MSKNWQTKTIGELCKLMTGGTPSRSKKEYFENGSINWLVSGDINRRIITECDNRITELGLENSSAKYLPINSVLIALNGQGKTRGMVAMLKIKATCNQSLVSIYPKDTEEIIPEYIFYFLESKYEELRKLTGDTGNDRRGLNMPILRKIEIPYPSLSEQQRLVKILDETFDKLDKAKENTQKNLQQSRNLFESVMNEAFSNRDKNKVSLEEVCEINSKLVDPKLTEFTNMYHIGGANIESKSGKLLNLQTAKEEKLISGKFIFDNSMVLYSKIRPYLMKVARPSFKGLCSADIYPLSPVQRKIDRDYLYYTLLTSHFTDYAIKGSGRAGMPKVNRNHLFKYTFSLPSIQEQQKITKKMDDLADQTRKLEAKYQQKSNSLEELKKSILSQAFSGNL